jgi:HEAT repeat protein
MGDDDVARFVAGSVQTEGGSTDRLAEAFQALVPEGERRKQVLAMAEEHAADSDIGQSESFPDLWNNVEHMLTSYSDEPFVSTDYARELSAARRQAVEVDQTSDDRLEAWLASVADGELQEMDFQLLVDLLSLEPDGDRWRDIANVVTGQIDASLRDGQFASAHRLITPITHAALSAEGDEVPAQAHDVTERMAVGRAMKRGLKRAGDADDAAFEELKQITATLGAPIIPALAEVLATEENAKGRRRLRGILMEFGDLAIASMHELMQSPSRDVRRTAMLLLRELGGTEALDAIEPMLADRDPKVQRDGIRSMLAINESRAHELMMDLVAKDDTAREALTDELSSVRDERAAPLCGLLVSQIDHRTQTELYLSAIEALGRLGNAEQVDVLKAALYRGEWWAPVRTKTLRAAAAEPLRKIGAPALETLREAANSGPRAVRTVARPAHARLESRR